MRSPTSFIDLGRDIAPGEVEYPVSPDDEWREGIMSGLYSLVAIAEVPESKLFSNSRQLDGSRSELDTGHRWCAKRPTDG